MNNPPGSLCILRLSAIGDVTHMIPVVRTLQKYWPDTSLTWIIGKNEANLVNNFPNINFIIFDKTKPFKSYLSVIKNTKNLQFDVLICAQVSLRANLLSALIRAKLKLGYDPSRAKDLHTLFIDESIPASTNQHVLDSFFSFIEYLGLYERELRWGYDIPDDAYMFAEKHIDKKRQNIIISPCSSHPKRNWRSEYYAEIADYATQSLNAHVLLCGGPSEYEKNVGIKIESAMQSQLTNLIGKDSLKKFLALLTLADLIITPDSGPAHMATGCGTPVLGLYAASNPKRSGPYLSIEYTINKYDEAARKFRNKPASQLKWGEKLEYDGVMDLISIQDVKTQLTKMLAH